MSSGESAEAPLLVRTYSATHWSFWWMYGMATLTTTTTAVTKRDRMEVGAKSRLADARRSATHDRPRRSDGGADARRLASLPGRDPRPDRGDHRLSLGGVHVPQLEGARSLRTHDELISRLQVGSLGESALGPHLDWSPSVGGIGHLIRGLPTDAGGCATPVQGPDALEAREHR